MIVTDSQFDLSIWQTPFSGVLFPSVSPIPVPDALDAMMFAVAPRGIAKYSKYLVRFERAAAFRCEDESVAPTKVFNALKREEPRSCTYIWRGSPWLKEFEEMQGVVDVYYGGKLKHYVLLGGDTIDEILASEDPKIEEVTGPCVVATYKI